MSSDEADLPEIRSRRSDVHALTAFISRTNRKVDIFWIDYKGRHVKYATLTRYGDTFPIATFVSHPWTFKDADSNQLVHPVNEVVYFPRPAERDDDIDMVFIGIPVYPLRTRCLQVVKKLWRESQIPHLDIPRILHAELLSKTKPDSIVWDEYEVTGEQ